MTNFIFAVGAFISVGIAVSMLDAELEKAARAAVYEDCSR